MDVNLGAAGASDDALPIDGPGVLRQLAERARRLRESKGLSRAYVAAGMGVAAATLRSWEQCLPSTARIPFEERWERMLECPTGWLRAVSVIALPAASGSEPEGTCATPVASTVADEIRTVGTLAVQRRYSSQVGRRYSSLEALERWSAIFAARYGVGGPEQTSLGAIGKAFGLTRERVRQILLLVTESARVVATGAPAIEALRSEAARFPVRSLEDFDQAYRPLLGASLSVRDADRFAREVLGWNVTDICERIPTQVGGPLKAVLATPDGLRLAHLLREQSRRMIRACGAANVYHVSGQLGDALGRAVHVRDIRVGLTAISGLEWLTDARDWYWFGPDQAANRVIDAVRRAYAVAPGRLDIEDLQIAVSRHRGTQVSQSSGSSLVEAPGEVLRAILCRLPWLQAVQYNDFRLVRGYSQGDPLSASERAVCAALQVKGGIATRAYLRAALVSSGILSSPNLHNVLAHSPALARVGAGYYRLAGHAVWKHAASRRSFTEGGAGEDDGRAGRKAGRSSALL